HEQHSMTSSGEKHGGRGAGAAGADDNGVVIGGSGHALTMR
ncbi:MAG: hypothetical protein QOF21_1851, partial [Actinomycetota bacterium]